MKESVRVLLDRYYPVSVEGRRFRDGTTPFYEWLLGGIEPASAVLLDVGAGPTPPAHRCLRGKVRRLIGVDPDPIVLGNRCLDEAYVTDGVHLPFQDGEFDAVYSDWTVEHLSGPLPVLREINRVLKPGASYWFRTTNLRHYVTLVSALTPHWFHRLVANRARAIAKDEHDPWRVHYKMNTPQAVRRLLLQAGFESPEVRLLESHPSYLMFNPLAFRVGVAYERLVNRFRRLAPLRLIILGRAQSRKSP
jgi:SAM-dependent methyltransferase